MLGQEGQWLEKHIPRSERPGKPRAVRFDGEREKPGARQPTSGRDAL